MIDARLRQCLIRFLPHVDERAIALTGGVAIDAHLSERRLSSGRHVLVDVDFVAVTGETVSSSVASQFLVSHFHLPQPSYPKFLIQLVDPVSRLRVDVFPDLSGSVRRARVLEVADVQVRVLDVNRILEHKLATLANASNARLVEEKHYKDAIQLGALCGRPVPSTAASHLCKGRILSRYVGAMCSLRGEPKRCVPIGAQAADLRSAGIRVRKLAVVLDVMVVAAFACVLALYLWLTDGEIQENRFATHVEARESLNRGWLPTGLPRSATLIHEWHDLDTNRCFGSFRFDPKERSTLEATLRPGAPVPIRIDRDPSFASTVPLDPSETVLKNRGFEFYSDQDFALAINWDKGIAYFWNSL